MSDLSNADPTEIVRVTVNSPFQSFFQAGFECSTHKLRSGKRLDLVRSTQHDVFVDVDFERLKQLGITTAREGLRWHLIENQAGIYDFSSAQRILESAQRNGIQVIWDLLHFGWPDHLDVFDASWPEAFAAFASHFGRLLNHLGTQSAFIAPINEISFMSWAGGDVAYLNPFATERGSELKSQLVRAYIMASRAVRAELQAVTLVSPEPAIHIVGRPDEPDDIRQAAEYRSAMFEAWDMITGRSHPELGGDEGNIDIIGINYYERNQWWNYGATIWRDEPEYRPFSEILREVYERYRRPMFVAETGTEDAERPAWFAYIKQEVFAAREAGVPLHGICWYPILNHPGWDDDRHCHNGLWDYPDQRGFRQLFEPLAREMNCRKDIKAI